MFRIPVQRTRGAIAVVVTCLTGAALGGDDAFADAVVSYDPGLDPAPGYTDPQTVLGSPERYTGEGVFPGVVSVFNPPFGTDEIVSIGAGGHLTIAFQTPVEDDPENPFGIDLLIFNNTGFIDAAWPSGIVGGLFGNDGGTIEVSEDGVAWFVVPNHDADGMCPTNGYLDTDPYDAEPGEIPSDFTRPVDPSLRFEDFDGLTYPEVVALYDGSGGGVGIDLASTGLSRVSFVRIVNPPNAQFNVEIDAFSDVASPARRALPQSFEIQFGARESGGLADLFESDDSYLLIEQRPAFTPLLPSIRVRVDGTSPSATASQITFVLEAASTALPPVVPQQVHLFDSDAAAWVLIDERLATLNDSVTEVMIEDDVQRFVETGSLAVRARLEWFDPGNVFSPAWGARIDQTFWSIAP